MEKYTNASAATWARTICLIVALLNSLLASFNKSPLPIDNEQLQQLVSTLITVVVAIINWWKNNSFTKEAIEADELFARLRRRTTPGSNQNGGKVYGKIWCRWALIFSWTFLF